MKRFYFLALLTFATLSLEAQTAFAPIAAKVRTQALTLSAETHVVSITPADKGRTRTEYTIRRTFSADGGFTAEWSTARFQSFQAFRADGSLLNGKLADLDKKLVIETQSDAARTTLRTIVSEKGAVKSDKTTKLTAGIALREDFQHLNSQAWQYGVRGALTLQSLSPDGGMVGDFQVVFRQVADPMELSDKYDYPAEFKTALEGRGPFIVADMSLQGIAAVFFPHHFYMIYAATPGLPFVGYFGEDPKAPTFQYVPK